MRATRQDDSLSLLKECEKAYRENFHEVGFSSRSLKFRQLSSSRNEGMNIFPTQACICLPFRVWILRPFASANDIADS